MIPVRQRFDALGILRVYTPSRFDILPLISIMTYVIQEGTASDYEQVSPLIRLTVSDTEWNYYQTVELFFH